jgi:hypothetical protein
MFDGPGGDLRLSRIAGLGTKESGRGLEHHPTDQPTHLWRKTLSETHRDTNAKTCQNNQRHDVFSPTVFAFLFSSLFYSLISSLCLSFFHLFPSFLQCVFSMFFRVSSRLYILHGFYNFVPYRPMVFLMFCAFFCTIYSLVSALFSP